MTPTVTLDCFSSAAGFVRQNWGDYDYSIGLESAFRGSGTFLVRHSDGSEFRIFVDRWGNAAEVAEEK